MQGASVLWLLLLVVTLPPPPVCLQARQMSIKMMPMSLVMESAKGKSYLINTMDCPGHVNFNDEVRRQLRGAGNAVRSLQLRSQHCSSWSGCAWIAVRMVACRSSFITILCCRAVHLGGQLLVCLDHTCVMPAHPPPAADDGSSAAG